MSKTINSVVFSVPFKGKIRVYGKSVSSTGTLDVDYTVEANNEQEAYEKVFGIGSYGIQNKEDPYKDDPYLAFFRET